MYKLQKQDIPVAKNNLTIAFMNYPIHKYIFPDENIRRKHLPSFMKFSIKTGMIFGDAYAISPDLKAIAVWIDPDHVIPNIIQTIRLGGLSVLLHIPLKDLLRSKKLWDHVESLHKKYAPEKHWYLESLGVLPNCQGQGLGKKLMEYKFEELDEMQIPCYLETHDDTNVKIYEKLGFEVVYQTELLQTGLIHYSLVRYPEK
ncbi:MAG: GNAT family N-acetyltransferase [Candidatus Lokiarchaeota archaeon]|nr:GNAT family N-acetyltransferase [Candidatus Lokiarchaeota archaeon]